MSIKSARSQAPGKIVKASAPPPPMQGRLASSLYRGFRRFHIAWRVSDPGDCMAICSTPELGHRRLSMELRQAHGNRRPERRCRPRASDGVAMPLDRILRAFFVEAPEASMAG